MNLGGGVGLSLLKAKRPRTQKSGGGSMKARTSKRKKVAWLNPESAGSRPTKQHDAAPPDADGAARGKRGRVIKVRPRAEADAKGKVAGAARKPPPRCVRRSR